MIRFLFVALVVTLWARGGAAGEALEIHIDADYSINVASAASIELGVRAALAEDGFRLGGADVLVTPRDHRGNVRRSLTNIESFIASPTAIAIIGGLHSPPYLTHKSLINRNGALTLLPWSAAGPITRADPGDENWIFRLSVDDRKSGPFLVREAAERGGCKRIALILLDTGWGRANEVTLNAALREHGQEPSVVAYFPSTVGKAMAGKVADTVVNSRADCAILLANAEDGAHVVVALGARNPDLRLFSHWGVTSDPVFTDQVSHELRTRMQLKMLQTCGLRREAEGAPVLKAAMAEAAPDVASVAGIPASTGFIHGYDLTRILMAAARQAAGTPEWQGDVTSRRRALKTALETLETPVDGILKRYVAPFGPYTAETPDAHEALGLDDLCLARFTASGTLEDAD